MAAIVAVVCGCRFMPQGAHWVETHGDGRVARIAGRPAGVIAIGQDRRLWAYPTDYARPWRQEGPQEARELTSSLVALYVLAPSGELSRVTDGHWASLAGSVAWGVTAIAASEDDHLFAVVGGRTRRVEGSELKEAPCGAVVAISIAAVGGDDIYVIDAEGGLFHGTTTTTCVHVTIPEPIRNIAVNAGRMVVVTKGGSVWRRRGEAQWQALPTLRKYRKEVFPEEGIATQVGLSAYSTWVLDQNGTVFLLSDET